MSNDLYDEIMKIRERRADSEFSNAKDRLLYKEGHRDARHAAAELAIGGSSTISTSIPAPLSDYMEIARLIGSIFFAGDFVAETKSERDLESLLIKTGHRYRSWEEVEAASDLSTPSDASAAPADNHNFEVCQHFNNWLIGQGLLLANHTEESDGPMAPAMNWIASVQAVIAASSPKCELTDEQIAAIYKTTFESSPGCVRAAPNAPPLVIAFGRAIAAASGPNAALVEALKELVMLVDDAYEGQYEIDSFTTQPGHTALAAAGMKE